ncbi:MAG TPA: hypothetical protein VE821_09490, partial [Pyrinomonadaceae bacterium]|nr:hypothetical protein [Pyrinomonadaceae bacterium]
GRRLETPPANSRESVEIQPHQGVTARILTVREAVFQVWKALTVPQTPSIRAPTGGGRNPAAAVL